MCTAPGHQIDPVAVADRTGGAIVAWNDYRVYADVYAQRVSGTGIVGDDSVTGVGDPTPSGLQLEGFRPNPTARAPSVYFSLSTSEHATLELLDVSGRVVFRREIGSLGPGRHRVEVAREGQLRPGVYLLKLAQGGTTLTTKLVRLK